MGKKNYSKMSTEKAKNESIHEILDPLAEVVEVEESKVDEYVEPKHYTGIVKGCLRLNVRKEPNGTADVLGIIPALSEVTVFPDESNDEWLRVVTDDPFDGYCMKKFIEAKQ